jgi:hypothetical protein
MFVLCWIIDAATVTNMLETLNGGRCEYVINPVERAIVAHGSIRLHYRYLFKRGPEVTWLSVGHCTGRVLKMQGRKGLRQEHAGQDALQAAVSSPQVGVHGSAKLKATKPFEVPTAAEFPNDETEANSWSISVVSKYLKSKLEMPQYVDNFKRHEIDGQKLITLDEEQVHGALEVGNKLHALKIASHAEVLRERVLEGAMIGRPKNVLDWNSAHLAAWLYYDKRCPRSSAQVLKSNLTGYKLKDATDATISKLLATVDGDELALAVEALKEIGNKGRNDAGASDKTGQPHSDNDTNDATEKMPVKKNKKTKTALQKRREKATAAGQVQQNEDAEDTSGTKGMSTLGAADEAHSAAYTSAMSSILTGMQHSSDSPARGAHLVLQAAEAASVPAPLRPSLEAATNLPTTAKGVAELRSISEAQSETSDDDGPSASKRTAHRPPGMPSSAASQRPKVDGKPRIVEPSDVSAPNVGDQDLQQVATQVEANAKGAERKKFLSKIAKLRKVVSDHQQHMEDLREQASILREENAAIRRQQQELLRQGSDSSELIQALLGDRNAALQELERVAALYDAHTELERERAQADLDALAQDTHLAHEETLAVLQLRNQELAGLRTVDFSLPTRGIVAPPKKVQPKRRFA